MTHPSFIDPKTGRRYKNYLTPVPGLNKPITKVTVDEFCIALCDRANDYMWRSYFDQIGWPEGYRYVLDGSEKYVRECAFPSMVKNNFLE